MVYEGAFSKTVTSLDGTFQMRLTTHFAAAQPSSPFTMKEFVDGLMRLVLMSALEDRWESMIGEISKNGRAVATVYLFPVEDLTAGETGAVSKA